MASDGQSEQAGSLPVTSLAILEALAVRHDSKLSTLTRCSQASLHSFRISTEAGSLPGPSEGKCWQCGHTHLSGQAALGACTCGITLCEPCWLRLTEQAAIMVDLGEVSQELVNGALEILTLDGEREKHTVSVTTELQPEKAAEATEEEDSQSKAEQVKGNKQGPTPKRQTRNFTKRVTRSAAKKN